VSAAGGAWLAPGPHQGSHHIYVHPDGGRRVTVPVHGNTELKPGTQRSILRDAGLSDADL